MVELNPNFKLRIEELTTEGWTLIDDKAQQLRQYYGDVVKLYDKLKNISNACTCKEDSNV